MKFESAIWNTRASAPRGGRGSLSSRRVLADGGPSRKSSPRGPDDEPVGKSVGEVGHGTAAKQTDGGAMTRPSLPSASSTTSTLALLSKKNAESPRNGMMKLPNEKVFCL